VCPSGFEKLDRSFVVAIRTVLDSSKESVALPDPEIEIRSMIDEQAGALESRVSHSGGYLEKAIPVG